MQGIVEDTYAPVVDFTTITVALAVAVQKGYFIDQIDVRTAFLHGDVDPDIYVTPPEGIDLCKPYEAVKLRKGLHGLKQRPRLWSDKWGTVM